MTVASIVEPARFVYSFAKEHGLLFLRMTHSGEAVIGRREGQARPSWALLEARRMLGCPVVIEDVPETIFDRRLSEIYSIEKIDTDEFESFYNEDLISVVEGLPQTADLLDSDSDAPIIRLINALIAEAVKTKASDIHIEPYEKDLYIRLRTDGMLRETLKLSAKMTPALTSRVKVMARLDIAEKRVPQDGRISLSLGERVVDVRVSTLPARFGERVVLRLLDKEQAQLDLDTLGMPAITLAQFKTALKRPNGIILVAGPTGSGKTTSLYGGLTLLNQPDRNILTIEDPVEYALDGIGQTQVNAKVGMTFATGLRAILRQDPDIVMVGEIRDVETAQIAVQASLTGHLVLSTVHTNSSVGTVTRLRDMGVEPFLLSSTLTAVMAQRLVRRLCQSCKEPYALYDVERDILDVAGLNLRDTKQSQQIYKSVGCDLCNNTGYEGRVGLYELVTLDADLKKLIHDDAGEQELAAYAFKDNDTLTHSGFRNVLAGVTSIEEVLRVVQQEIKKEDSTDDSILL